jgi:dTDP-4-dehydrorhamnose reductase
MHHRILITGSSGMLGVDLCGELRGGCEVIGADIVHSPQSIVHSFKKCDITDKKEVAGVIAEAKPDVVIHAAAWTDVDGCERDSGKAYRVNSEGTKNVALACKAANSVLIYISTDYVFDGRKRTPYRETDRAYPINVYGDSKLKGEEAIRGIWKKHFIIRTSWMYGKHGRNFVNTVLAKAGAMEPLKVVSDQIGSPTYAKDLAIAIHALITTVFRTAYSVQRTAYGTYHVTNSGSVSWYGYAREILKLAGSKTKVIPISSAELDRPAKRPAISLLNNSKFMRFTGYRMRSYKEALKAYLFSNQVRKVRLRAA